MPGGSRTENCVSIYMYGCQPLSVVFDMTIPLAYLGFKQVAIFARTR